MIREGHPADVAALRAIQASALSDPWPELLELAVDGPQPLLVLTEPTGSDDSRRDGSQRDVPIAYALAIEADGVAYLAELAVAPDAQGQGHGGELLAAFVDCARDRGIATCRLTARADDDRVHDFYASHGFEARDRIPDHYEDGDGLVFVRSLVDER